MQSIFVDATSDLQLYSTKLPGHYIVVQAVSKLISGSATPTNGLLTLFLLMEYGKSSITYLF